MPEPSGDIQLSAEPLWAEWSDVWPEEPEPSCLAVCFGDVGPTDSEAEVTGLSHAYLSVTANEGFWTFQGLLLSGTTLTGLSLWLSIHIAQTKNLNLFTALLPLALLAGYCWGYILLTYRLRRFAFEIAKFCWTRIPTLSIQSLVKETRILVRTPRWLVAKLFVVRRPGYKRPGSEFGARGSLCSVCKAMITESPLLVGSSALFQLARSSRRWPHHPPWMLKESAKHCHLCSLLLLSVSKDAGNRDDAWAIICDRGEKPEVKNLQVHVSDPVDTLTARIWERPCWRTGKSVLRLQVEGREAEAARPLILDVDTSEAFEERTLDSDDSSKWETAQRWIRTCSTRHDVCRNGILDIGEGLAPFVPAGLLEIVTETQDCKDTEGVRDRCVSVKLVTAKQKFDRTPAYAAFGHRWGKNDGEQGACPTARTLNNALTVDQLHESFRQAVFIASSLGLRYLWIKNLCAERPEGSSGLGPPPEVPALVYAHAACTVSTAESPGILSSRITRYDDCPLLFKSTSTNAKASVIIARAPATAENNRHAEMDTLFDRCVDSHQPNRHQAFFQERLLSRRLLFVCDEGSLFFECDTLRASSCHPDGVPYLPSPLIYQPNRSQQQSGASNGTETNSFGTYTYQTRKKIVDAENGAWKFETLVVPTPEIPRVITAQEQLENLQAVNSWRTHRGSFHRLLRQGVNWNFQPRLEHPNDCWAEKLALNQAWFDLIGAFASMERSVFSFDQDYMADIMSIISREHSRSDSQAEYCQGLWLGLLPLNLLWFRRAEHASSPTTSDVPLPTIPTWSWLSVGGPISHGLADTAAELKSRLETRREPKKRRMRHVQVYETGGSVDQMWRDVRVVPLIGEVAILGPVSDTGGQSLKISYLCDLIPVDTVKDEGGTELIYDDKQQQGTIPGASASILPVAVFLHPSKGAGGICAVDLWRRNPQAEVQGIIVSQRGGNLPAEYLRVGYFKVRQFHAVETIIRSIDNMAATRFLTLR